MMSNLPIYLGNPSEPVYQAEKALRLNPRPPNWYFWLLGQAQYAAGHYESAVVALRGEETYRTGSRRILAASLAQPDGLDRSGGKAGAVHPQRRDGAARRPVVFYGAGEQPGHGSLHKLATKACRVFWR